MALDRVEWKKKIQVAYPKSWLKHHCLCCCWRDLVAKFGGWVPWL